MMIDIVQPYATILSVRGISITDDIVPMRQRTNRTCMQTKSIEVSSSNAMVGVTWTVGGGFVVDQTALLIAKWDDLPLDFDGESHPTGETYHQLLRFMSADFHLTDKKKEQVITITPSEKAHFHRRHSTSPTQYRPVFAARVDLTSFQEGDRVAVFAFAQLDSHWNKTYSDGIPPQSHIVNARTNASWFHETASPQGRKTVQGHLHWFSTPVTITVGASDAVPQETSKRLPAGYEYLQSLEEKLQDEIAAQPFPLIVVSNIWLFGFIFFVWYDLKRRNCFRNKEDRGIAMLRFDTEQVFGEDPDEGIIQEFGWVLPATLIQE